jgi:hypothetical protein
MILREGQGAIDIEGAINRLRHENGKGAHIYIRPTGTHSSAAAAGREGTGPQSAGDREAPPLRSAIPSAFFKQ